MRRSSPLLATVAVCVLQGALLMTAMATPLRLSELAGEDLRGVRGGQRMKLQDVTGDTRPDLLLVRAPLPGDPAGQGRLEVWERRAGTAFEGSAQEDGFFLRLGSGLPSHALDVQGAYVPGGVNGAGRDLVVLQNAPQPALLILRNQGPGSTPRFQLRQRLALPGGRRLHYPVQAPPPPSSPGFVNLPMPVTLADGRIQVVRFDNTGVARLLVEPLDHEGGAQEVLLVADAGNTTSLISIGAGPPLLWRVAGDGYVASTLPIAGWPSGVAAVEALLGNFDGNALYPELVVAFDDGRTLRWNGDPPPDSSAPLAFGSPVVVAEDARATDLVELEVDPERNGSLRRALLIASSAGSDLFVADAGLAGQPFGASAAQRLPAALAAFGDFGLDLLFVANAGLGVDVYRGTDGVGGGDGSAFSVGWRELDSVQVVGGALQATVSTPLAETVPRSYQVQYRTQSDATWKPMLAVRHADFVTDASIVDSVVRLPAGTLSDIIHARRPPPISETGSDFTSLIRLVETTEADSAPIREPRERATSQVFTGCVRDPGSATACLFVCVDANTASGSNLPAAGKGASSGFFPPDTEPLLHRLRDGLLRQSAKGREYIENYESLSLGMYGALLRRPSALLDYARAHDAWEPAIRSLVDGDGSAIITSGMVEHIDVIAAHLALDGDAALRDAVEREYALLDPRGLVGMSMTQLRTRYEALPTATVFESGFEATVTR